MSMKSNDSLFGLNSEYKRLKSVLLFKPDAIAAVEYPDAPEAVLHRSRVNYDMLEKEYKEVIALYQQLGVITFFLPSGWLEEAHKECLFNIMFTRDVLFMTPWGAIMARMGKNIRQPEVAYAEKVLETKAIPVIDRIHGNGTFEGADALWLDERLLLVGVGNRTNQAGFNQIQSALTPFGVTCIPVPFNQTFPQHLLGLLQFVDSNLALVRQELIDPSILQLLDNHGIGVVNVPENKEVKERQAMNIITVNPREIIMPNNCPETQIIYKEAGIKVVAEVQIDQLIRGGGGLACATAPISREM